MTVNPKKNQKRKIFDKKILFLLLFLLSLGIILHFFLLDWLLKFSIVKVGEKAFQAKVEVGEIHLDLFKGELFFKRIAIADKDNAFKNIFQCTDGRVLVSTSALLRSQIYLPEMWIKGIELGGVRQNSGLLSKNLKNDKEKKDGKLNGVKKYYSLESIEQRLNINQILDISSLKTMQTINQASEKVSRFPDEINSKLAEPDLNAEVDKLQKQWDEVQNSAPTNIAEYPAYFKKLDDLNKQISSVQRLINQKQGIVSSGTEDLNSSIEKIDSQSKKDIVEINGKIDQVNVQQESLFDNILGPKVVGYKEKAFKALRIIKKLKKEKKPSQLEQKFKKTGDDIVFPIWQKRPRVLVEKINIEGWWGKKQRANEFIGQIKELVNNQNIRKKPTLIRIKSKEYSSDRKTDILGTVDFREDNDSALFDIDRVGYPLKSSYWDANQIPFQFTSGNYNLNAQIGLVKNIVNMKVKMTTVEPTLVKTKEFNDKNFVHQLLEGVSKVNKTFLISINIVGDNVGIDSNLDELVNQELNRVVEEKKEKLKKEVQADIDKEVNKKKQEIQKQIDAAKASVEKDLKKETNKVQKELDKINAEIAKKKAELNKQKKQIEDKLKKEAKKVEENLKKSLQNLF